MKQKSLAFAAIIVLSLVALLGCSPDDDAADGSPLVTGRLADLQGTWTRNCYAENNFIGSTDYRVVETYEISGSNISASKTYYATNDVNCTNSKKFTDQSSYSNLAIGDNVTAGNFKDYQFVYSVQSIGRTPHDNSTSSLLNSNFSCLLSNWETENYTDLLNNEKCGHPKNITILNTYRIVGTNLFLGKPLNEADHQTYPSVDDSKVYIKQ